MENTIKVVLVPAGGYELQVEVRTNHNCPTCGREQEHLYEHYLKLGEEAAEALYMGTPSGFWNGIQDYAVEKAIRAGLVSRPLTAKDIASRW